MTRLPSELRRLYLPPDASSSPDTGLIDAQGRVRAMALCLARPAEWDAVSRVWQAVQSELALPAPAIAVSGSDGYQLWFSLAQAVPVAEAHAFLRALCDRYLRDIAPTRLDLLPALGTGSPSPAWPVDALPVRLVQPGQWSAFVAPDLAPIFAETPWLDIPPSPEGQADLLSRLHSIQPQEWQAAQALLHTAPVAPTPAGPDSPRPAPASSGLDPHGFLLEVMNDTTVALALRIDVAKAQLPYTLPAR